MDRNRATYEAFDGVELSLLSGGAVSVPAFTTQEAVHYLRLFSHVAESGAAHRQFLDEFPERINVLDVTLADLGFACEFGGQPITGDSVTVGQAIRVMELLVASEAIDGWREQSEMLETFPQIIGLDLGPQDVFGAARTFVEAFYVTIYGLARDFLSRLSSPPRAQATTEGGRDASRSRRDSTT